MFLSVGVLPKATEKKNLRNNPIYTFRNFQGLWRSSFIVKELSLPFIVKASNLTERNSSKDHTLQRHAIADVCKTYSYKDFRKFTGKYLYQIQYLMNLQAPTLQLCCKRDPSADVFL